jgi:hypothetical protein
MTIEKENTSIAAYTLVNNLDQGLYTTIDIWDDIDNMYDTFNFYFRWGEVIGPGKQLDSNNKPKYINYAL